MLSTNTWYLYLTFRTLQLLHTASFPTCIPIIISRKFLHQLYWSIGLAWFVHFTFYSFPDLYISPLMSAPLPTHSNESSSSELTQLKVTRLCKTFEGFYMSWLYYEFKNLDRKFAWFDNLIQFYTWKILTEAHIFNSLTTEP